MAELNERLFTHFVRGAWRAPYAQRMLAVGRDLRQPLGRIACAGPRDVARAMAALQQPPDPPPNAMNFMAALRPIGEAFTRLRAAEGFDDPWPDTFEPVALAPGEAFVLLSSAALPAGRLVPLVVAGAQKGMIWKPAPGGAASAHLLMRCLGPLSAGRLAMVQGDHATGAALAEALAPGARLLWASANPPPDLPLTIATKDPGHP